jgi:hypothetical protein
MKMTLKTAANNRRCVARQLENACEGLEIDQQQTVANSDRKTAFSFKIQGIIELPFTKAMCFQMA